jgi:hypothetical protein
MRVESHVEYEEVQAAFERDNDIEDRSYSWALEAVEIANQQFGHTCELASAARAWLHGNGSD